ncbi:MAG: hypothetical protein AB1461_07455 [Thermodesulfobacteriota bacterium]
MYDFASPLRRLKVQVVCSTAYHYFCFADKMNTCSLSQIKKARKKKHNDLLGIFAKKTRRRENRRMRRLLPEYPLTALVIIIN